MDPSDNPPSNTNTNQPPTTEAGAPPATGQPQQPQPAQPPLTTLPTISTPLLGTSATPSHPHYSPDGPHPVAAAHPSAATATTTTTRPYSSSMSDEHQHADPLFRGLSRDLHQSEQQRHQRRAHADESHSESEEESKDASSSQRGRPSRKDNDSPATPLIASGSHSSSSDNSPSHSHSQSYARRSTASTSAAAAAKMQRRHIRLTRGEFEISQADRLMIHARRSWYERWRGKQIQREEIFRNNQIKSSRYEWYNFLPKNLFEQLSPSHRPANFFFLCIAFLQCIHEISTTQGRPTILVPLLFVLSVTAIKDAIEDYSRHKADRTKNQAKYKVFRFGSWRTIKSKNILVGDLIRIQENQRIPADCLLVSSGISNGSYAFVDTKELDGETNLKPKGVPSATFLSKYKREQKKILCNVEVKCDMPNQVMNQWNGEITLDGNIRENVNLGNFLLTDSVLRNTNWIIGLVVYTGEDTKIRSNMSKQLLSSKTKSSSVFKLTTRLFLFMIVIQVILCLIAAIDSGIRQNYNIKHNVWYLQPTQSPLYFAFLRLFTWFIIVKDFIPISLYVSLELVQFWQAQFIAWDKKMTATVNGVEYPAMVQTSKLNEELAQISYIFSDKTGTLTRNSMVFRKCLIGEEVFGTGTTEAGRLRTAKQEKTSRRSSRRGSQSALSSSFTSSSSSSSEESKKRDEDDLDFDSDSDDESVSDDVAQTAPDDPNELRVPHVEFNETQRIADAIADLAPLSTRLEQLSNPSQADLVQLFLYASSLNNSVFPKIRRAEDAEQEEKEEEKEEPVEGDSHIGTPSAIESETPSTATPSQQQDQPQIRGDEPVTLEASSPDERALVAFAQAMGFELIRRSGGKVELRLRKIDPSKLIEESHARHERHKQVRGEDDEAAESPTSPIPAPLPAGSYTIESFQELCLLDFTSKRKRMTVVLRPIVNGQPTNHVVIFIKGADSILKQYLAAKKLSQEKWDATFTKLSEFGSESLRTLLLGYSIKSFDWWSKYHEDYKQTEREQGESEKGHVEGTCSPECHMCAIENRIEKACEFELLGATAIEDKLQDGVPQTLKELQHAGIKIWMLTGDVLSTAISIGVSCNLIQFEMFDEERFFTFDRDLNTAEAIDLHIQSCQKRMKKLLMEYQQKAASQPDLEIPTFGLGFHGDVFKILLEEHLHYEHQRLENPEIFESTVGKNSDSLLDRFFELASSCKAVIACRLEPKEKADIVSKMKKRTQKVCLAIGDGNNDTPMIKVAHVGVGIRGVEGTSAVSSSDFAISEFRFLKRLLLVHGRLNNRRITTMISYIFYKSSLLVMTLFFFGAYSSFSGTFLYLDWAVQLHNVCYTALPILVYAVFDRDLTMETLEAHSHIYSLTRGPILFNYSVFAQWMVVAFFQAVLCFWIPFHTFEDTTSPSPNGQSFGLWTTSMCIYVCVVLVTNLRLIWEFQSWTWLHHFTLEGSTIVFFLAMIMFSSSPKFAVAGADYYYVFFRLAELSRFWLVVALTVMCCVMVDLAHHWILVTWFDAPTYRLVEAERLHGPKAVGKLARRLHAKQLKQEQLELLEQHTTPTKGAKGATDVSTRRSSAEASTTSTAATTTAEAQKNGQLSRRGRGATKDERASVPSSELYASSDDEERDETPKLTIKPSLARQHTYTGSAFGFTPRASFMPSSAATPSTTATPSTGATATTQSHQWPASSSQAPREK